MRRSRSIAMRSASRSTARRRWRRSGCARTSFPTGSAALELLEATALDSPIARFADKRGPGLHHVTLRVDDIRAALAQLKSRDVRLVDEEPRPGAEGALVAFIHPSAAHGVLVELKEAARHAVDLRAHPMAFGDLQLTMLHDGPFRLDGGAMFGVVPRPLWERVAPPDDRNRIQLAMRPLLVEADWGRLLVDCGVGRQDGREAARHLRARSRRASRPRAGRARPDARRHRPGPRHAPALRSLRRGDARASATRSCRASARAGTSSAPPSGRTPRIRTSAIAPATCRTTSCRCRTRASSTSMRATARSGRACAWCAPAATPASIRSSTSSRAAGRRSSSPT